MTSGTATGERRTANKLGIAGDAGRMGLLDAADDEEILCASGIGHGAASAGVIGGKVDGRMARLAKAIGWRREHCVQWVMTQRMADCKEKLLVERDG